MKSVIVFYCEKKWRGSECERKRKRQNDTLTEGGYRDRDIE